jgi:hypothetical protein
MITLAFYTYISTPTIHPIGYVAYFRSDDELQEILSRVLNSTQFKREPAHYILRAMGTKTMEVYYTDTPTEAMTIILRDYNQVFKRAYGLAESKIWHFAWKAAGEKRRIAWALLRMDAAREMVTDEKWGK